MNNPHGNQREATLIGYLAGIIDGEGTINITVTKPKGYNNPRYTGRIAIGMVNEEIIDLFHQRYGGSKRVECVPNRKPIYRWMKVGDSQPLIDILEELLPCLIVKKRQAELVLEYIKTKKTSGFQRNQGIPEEELQRRQDFYLRVKELNAVGAPATTNREDT